MSVIEQSSSGGSSKPRRRLVRKRSVWENLYNSPQDWFMQIEEEYEGMIHFMYSLSLINYGFDLFYFIFF